MDSYKVENGILVEYPGNTYVVEVPDGVRGIASGLFDDSCISYLTLQDTVEELGVQTFCWCDRLNVIRFSSRIRRLEHNVFNSIAAQQIHLPQDLEYIGNGAFLGSASLLFVRFPEQLRFISENAFLQCISLRYVTFQNQLQQIGEQAFQGAGLEYLSLPGSLLNIGRFAFAGCENLRHVTLREGLLHIGDGAFRGCTLLRRVRVPDSVVSIGKKAFWDCDMLETAVLPEHLRNIALDEIFPAHTKIVFRESAESERQCEECSASGLLKCLDDHRKRERAALEEAAAMGCPGAHMRLYKLDKKPWNRIHLLRAASLGSEEAVEELIDML